MKTYRAAILGCRARGSAAARAYHQHPRTELVGLCDLIEERRNLLGAELGVMARYDDFQRMIELERPDIVAIPTGTEFHYEMARAVLGGSRMKSNPAVIAIAICTVEALGLPAMWASPFSLARGNQNVTGTIMPRAAACANTNANTELETPPDNKIATNAEALRPVTRIRASTP